MSRYALAVFVLILLGGCGTLSRPPAPRDVVVTRARRGSLPEIVHLSGQVHAGRRATVSPSLAGRVVRVNAREGDVVRAGEPVIWLDTRQQEAQIAVQQAAVGQARARLGQLQAQFGMTAQERLSQVQKAKEGVTQADLAIREAQARLETAEVDMKRKKDLLASKAVARTDYETAVLNFNLSQDELATARSRAAQAREELRLAQVTARDRTVHESDVVAAQAEVEQAEASLLESRAALDQMVLEAPISGTVVSRKVETGQAVSPGGEPLLQIVDEQGAWVTATVAQSEIGRLRPGMPAEIVLAQEPGKPLRAKVKRLIPATDPSTSTVRVSLALERAPAGLLDQGPASIRVRVGLREGVLVPRQAVVGERRNLHVVLVRNARAWRTPVTVALTNEANALVSAGVQPGEAVVVEGGQFLSAGDPVEILRTLPEPRR